MLARVALPITKRTRYWRLWRTRSKRCRYLSHVVNAERFNIAFESVLLDTTILLSGTQWVKINMTKQFKNIYKIHYYFTLDYTAHIYVIAFLTNKAHWHSVSKTGWLLIPQGPCPLTKRRVSSGEGCRGGRDRLILSNNATNTYTRNFTVRPGLRPVFKN